MLEFTKYLIYASFILNIACGVWVLTGIVQWIAHVSARFWEQRFEAQDADGHVVIQSTAFHVRSFGLMRDVQLPRV